ncbi:unnamed protein product, partial [Thlaspi arvense]
FYLDPFSPNKAAARAKESAKKIINVKTLINKNVQPYVQNDLHLRALEIKSQKIHQQALPNHRQHRLLLLVWKLDYAARSKSSPDAEKYYL